MSTTETSLAVIPQPALCSQAISQHRSMNHWVVGRLRANSKSISGSFVVH